METPKRLAVTHFIDKSIDFLVSNIQKLSPNADETVPSKPVLISKYKMVLLSFIKSYETRANNVNLLNRISTLTGIPSLTVGSAWFVLFLVLTKRWFRDSARVFYQSFGLILPVYHSLKAIEKPKSDDDERYLSFC